ncbi:MAG: T9SS type A sorting domain-containing protein [Flavobacteriaceae bacterium]|nr:T9SS type A sorting domain-containing protein [Flavobacteriaceae bacterium]
MRKALVVSLFFLASIVYSQEYKKMIDKGNYTLKSIQNSANQYFSITGKGKGTGYKQYKRWEYNAQRMVNDYGYVNSSSFYLKELEKYNRLLNNTSRKAITTTANWKQLGPNAVTLGSGWNHGIGRITSLAIEEGNVNHLIVGSPTGGVWKSTNKGTTWTSLSDNFTSMAVYSLAIDPTDATKYYWGSTSGNIYVSTNSGNTWSALGKLGFGPVTKIIVNPNNTSIMFATDNWSGIYKSTNGGVNWTKVTGDSSGLDVDFKPGDYNTIYATGTQFHKSTDNGVSWTTVTTGFGTGEKLIAVSPANANAVYVLEENNGKFGGFYVSTNDGATFTKKTHTGKNYFGYSTLADDDRGQAPRDMAIAVSPTNINEVHIAGIISFRSLDGGTTFTPTSEWYSSSTLGYCHADIDDMIYYGTELFVISDGGIYIADDPAGTIDTNFYVSKTQGMGIHQFYKIGISQTSPAIITGGSQDNGANVLIGGVWKHWLGADGMETFIDKNDSKILYGTTQNGSMSKSTDSGATRFDLTTPTGKGNWVTPFEQDPTAANTIYVGYNIVYKSTDGGTTWTAISQDFTNSLDNLKIAKTDANTIYASENSNLYKTTTGTGSWTLLTGYSGGHINFIAIHPSNPNKIAIATANSAKVQVSTDGGVNWTTKNSGLPNFAALTLAWDDNGNDGLYVGMNYGIYYIDNTLTTWQNFSNLLPNVKVNELEINTAENKIYAGTYGRGVWSSDLYNKSLSIDKDELEKSVMVYPNPTSNKITINLKSSSKGEFRVFNLQGQLVQYEKANEINNKSIDISKLSNGTYFVRLNIEGGIVTKKIIKE